MTLTVREKIDVSFLAGRVVNALTDEEMQGDATKRVAKAIQHIHSNGIFSFEKHEHFVEEFWKRFKKSSELRLKKLRPAPEA